MTPEEALRKIGNYNLNQRCPYAALYRIHLMAKEALHEEPDPKAVAWATRTKQRRNNGKEIHARS